jgi:ribonuclease III
MMSAKSAPHRDLSQVLGHVFRSHDLLDFALTHPSVTQGRAKRRFTEYERLEFLGDRVLGLVVAEILYLAFPQEPEGDLAKRHVALVRSEALARVAQTIRLGDYLSLSNGEDSAGGRDNPALLADACEAVIGALYMDGGFDCARTFVQRYWTPLLTELTQPPKDAKTRLQEWAQSKNLGLPAYTVTGQDGPAHNTIFLVQVKVEGYPPACGSGSSKRVAEQEAASLLLKALIS